MQNDSSPIVDTIQAMHSQETAGYTCGDYLNMYPPEVVAVNVDCRTKMAQWCYSVSYREAELVSFYGCSCLLTGYLFLLCCRGKKLSR